VAVVAEGGMQLGVEVAVVRVDLLVLVVEGRGGGRCGRAALRRRVLLDVAPRVAFREGGATGRREHGATAPPQPPTTTTKRNT